jgi:ABC-2 type transport system ATP-binding protein
VAQGTPAALGGRDVASATIRFRCAATPPVGALADGHWELTTSDEVSLLHQLTAWSLDTGHALEGLVVSRPTLEDIYLRLTS